MNVVKDRVFIKIAFGSAAFMDKVIEVSSQFKKRRVKGCVSRKEQFFVLYKMIGVVNVYCSLVMHVFVGLALRKLKHRQ